jgi:hypothetical protein
VTVDRLDAEVVAQFFAHLDAFYMQAVDDAALEEARTAVEDATGTVERLAAVVPTHPAAIGAHQEALAAAEAALGEAEDRRDHLVASARPSGPDRRVLREDWSTLVLDDRREILRAGIVAVLVRRASSRTARLPVADRVLVLFRGEAPDGLSDNGRSGPVTTWTWDADPTSLVATA